jgi:transposase
MVVAEEEVAGRPIRRWRTLSEKRRIAELTFEPGASVAVVARANGVNANQVFKWRRLLQQGELNEPAAIPTSLLPVMLSVSSETAEARATFDLKQQPPRGGSIHIEIPGKAMISVEGGADPALLRSILESLRK